MSKYWKSYKKRQHKIDSDDNCCKNAECINGIDEGDLCDGPLSVIDEIWWDADWILLHACDYHYDKYYD